MIRTTYRSWRLVERISGNRAAASGQRPTAYVIHSMMRGVVIRGTASRLQGLGLGYLAGKTGNGDPAGGEGKSGEVVGTSLNYAAMPFIRYELGDVVTRGPERCACGSPFSTLAVIQGRVVNYFPLPDGRVLHPWLGQRTLSTKFSICSTAFTSARPSERSPS